MECPHEAVVPRNPKQTFFLEGYGLLEVFHTHRNEIAVDSRVRWRSGMSLGHCIYRTHTYDSVTLFPVSHTPVLVLWVHFIDKLCPPCLEFLRRQLAHTAILYLPSTQQQSFVLCRVDRGETPLIRTP